MPCCNDQEAESVVGSLSHGILGVRVAQFEMSQVTTSGNVDDQVANRLARRSSILTPREDLMYNHSRRKLTVRYTVS